MTLLYSDELFLAHETGDHPENAGRIRGIPARLEHAGLWARCKVVPSPQVDRRRLARVHTRGYIDELWAYAKSGGGHIEADTVVSPQSYDVALHAVGAACDAVERVLRGEDSTAFCLVRPPGHHALTQRAMGFCLFNNAAVAARTAVDELGVSRVLIVDWDVHHGNGTQATFWEDPRVGFFSAHRYPFYPGTGDEDEIGAGDGLGTTRNLPFAYNTTRQTYLNRFRIELEDFADRIRPELVIVSAGFDTHRRDPVGGLGHETEDYITLTNYVLDVADVHAGGRVVSVLEGGYDPKLLGDAIAVHLQAMLDRENKSTAAECSTSGN